MTKIAGDNFVKTIRSKTDADRDTVVVELRGPYNIVKAQMPSQGATGGHIPSGYVADSVTISAAGEGEGLVTINCVNFGTDGSGSAESQPTKVSYRIDMAEVQTDLRNHPSITAAARDLINKWLATDVSRRTKVESGTIKYYYVDSEDEEHEITDDIAKKYFAAYNKGIENYIRYMPILEKVSSYRRVPGLTIEGRKVTGGSAKFSSDIGEWDAPDINLQGYASQGFFKSADRWEQSGDTTWTRTEQWTWSPDYNSDDTSWIYGSSTPQQESGGST